MRCLEFKFSVLSYSIWLDDLSSNEKKRKSSGSIVQCLHEIMAVFHCENVAIGITLYIERLAATEASGKLQLCIPSSWSSMLLLWDWFSLLNELLYKKNAANIFMGPSGSNCWSCFFFHGNKVVVIWIFSRCSICFCLDGIISVMCAAKSQRERVVYTCLNCLHSVYKLLKWAIVFVMKFIRHRSKLLNRWSPLAFDRWQNVSPRKLYLNGSINSARTFWWILTNLKNNMVQLHINQNLHILRLYDSHVLLIKSVHDLKL